MAGDTQWGHRKWSERVISASGEGNYWNQYSVWLSLQQLKANGKEGEILTFSCCREGGRDAGSLLLQGRRRICWLPAAAWREEEMPAVCCCKGVKMPAFYCCREEEMPAFSCCREGGGKASFQLLLQGVRRRCLLPAAAGREEGTLSLSCCREGGGDAGLQLLQEGMRRCRFLAALGKEKMPDFCCCRERGGDSGSLLYRRKEEMPALCCCMEGGGDSGFQLLQGGSRSCRLSAATRKEEEMLTLCCCREGGDAGFPLLQGGRRRSPTCHTDHPLCPSEAPLLIWCPWYIPLPPSVVLATYSKQHCVPAAVWATSCLLLELKRV